MPNRYKKIVIMLLVSALLSVSLFGFLSMTHGIEGCDSIVPGMTDAGCPFALISMALHHIAAYGEFTQVPVTSTLAILLAIALAAAAYLALEHRVPISPPAFIRARRGRFDFPKIKGNWRFLEWLTRLEHSPSA